MQSYSLDHELCIYIIMYIVYVLNYICVMYITVPEIYMFNINQPLRELLLMFGYESYYDIYVCVSVYVCLFFLLNVT